MIHVFDCVLVGHGTLPLACAEVLLAGGSKIRVVISRDPLLLRWAAVREIPHSTELHALAELLAGRSPDFLFSIGNERLIPDETLALCKSAINYHDGPLPLYAGSHVTSWALMQREQTYAVTWHLMTRHTDAGDILRQTPVRISSDDTALTLNAKCYEAALGGFALLTDDLANDRVQPHAQDLSRRTFFHRDKRPVNGAVLNWAWCAEDLCALVRALAFGSYSNPLGFPKVLLGGEFLAIDTLDMHPTRSAQAPGTIAAIEPDTLAIATASCDVVLRQVKTLAGEALSIDQLVTRFRLQVGDVLPELEPLTANQLNETTTSVSRHERFWLGRLAAARALGLPYSTSSTSAAASSGPKTNAPIHHTLTLPPESVALIKGWGDAPADLLLHVFLAYVARINGQATFSIGLREARLRSELDGLTGFFATAVPLQVSLDLNGSFKLHVDISRQEISQLRSHRTYALDMVARNPESVLPASTRGTQPWLIVAQLMGSQPDAAPAVHDGLIEKMAMQPPHALVFQIAPDGLSFSWIDDSAALSHEQLEQMGGQYLTFLKNCLASPTLPLRSLPLLTDADRLKLQAACNEPADALEALPPRQDGF